MIKVGVAGLGLMGWTHLDAWNKRHDARVVAVADRNPDRLSVKKEAGNIAGQASGGFRFADLKHYADVTDLIHDPQVQLVDICLPTPFHVSFASEALRAGKHVLVEKPLARTSGDAYALAQEAEQAASFAMPAMCMRFWPGWAWLKQAIDDQAYGPVLAATFRRVGTNLGSPFYLDGHQCGGAILDLHLHDTDFIHYCFGPPRSVTSFGYTKLTGAIDHVVTRYEYDGIPLVVAEGGWAMAGGFGFEMSYTVNFARATATFRFDGQNHVRLAEEGQEPREVELPPGLGYDGQIGYLVDCIKSGLRPQTVTLTDAAHAIATVEAEAESIETGQPVRLSRSL